MPRLLTRLAPLAVLAAALGSAAVAQDKTPDAMQSMPGMTARPAPNAAETPADKAYAKANATMMRDMDAKPSGDADRDFVTMMLPHHQGAVDMAKIELQYGKDPKLRAMAAGVIEAQEAEIAGMKSWQAKHPR